MGWCSGCQLWREKKGDDDHNDAVPLFTSSVCTSLSSFPSFKTIWWDVLTLIRSVSIEWKSSYVDIHKLVKGVTEMKEKVIPNFWWEFEEGYWLYFIRS